MPLSFQKPQLTIFYSLPFVLLILFLITTLRVVALFISPLELSVDEAQYWNWSHEINVGYFSKPPFIAWLISCSTFIFGDS